MLWWYPFCDCKPPGAAEGSSNMISRDGFDLWTYQMVSKPKLTGFDLKLWKTFVLWYRLRISISVSIYIYIFIFTFLLYIYICLFIDYILILENTPHEWDMFKHPLYHPDPSQVTSMHRDRSPYAPQPSWSTCSPAIEPSFTGRAFWQVDPVWWDLPTKTTKNSCWLDVSYMQDISKKKWTQ